MYQNAATPSHVYLTLLVRRHEHVVKPLCDDIAGWAASDLNGWQALETPLEVC